MRACVCSCHAPGAQLREGLACGHLTTMAECAAGGIALGLISDANQVEGVTTWSTNHPNDAVMEPPYCHVEYRANTANASDVAVIVRFWDESGFSGNAGGCAATRQCLCQSADPSSPVPPLPPSGHTPWHPLAFRGNAALPPFNQACDLPAYLVVPLARESCHQPWPTQPGAHRRVPAVAPSVL